MAPQEIVTQFYYTSSHTNIQPRLMLPYYTALIRLGVDSDILHRGGRECRTRLMARHGLYDPGTGPVGG